MMLVLVMLALAGVAEAQTIVGDRLQLATGPCTIHSGSGAPAGALGAVCDTYYRTDSPYTMYVKSGASTWTAVFAIDGVATGQVLASNGTGALPVYTATPTVTTLTATGVGGGNGVNLTSTNPIFRMQETDATADNGIWMVRADTEALLYRTLNDAQNASGTYLRVERTGTTIDSMTLGGALTQPETGYFQNLGSLSRKFLTLHAAELWVETLVAQNTIATIGGRILVGPTTTLTSDLTSGATSIIVKHNQIVNGDRLLMEANGKVEFFAVTSASSGTGPYTYSVTRNLDGTGANDWIAGDAVFNTGQVSAGSGFIDMFSLGSSAFVGFQSIFNYDAALTAYSSDYFEADPWAPFGNSANDTVNDAVYIGAPATFSTMSMSILVPVVSSSTMVWEYWNGAAWTTFTPAESLSAVGPGYVNNFGAMTGWATTTVNGVSAYWIRIRITVVGGGTTAGSWRLTKRGPQQWGPAIIGNVRTSDTYNDWYPRWAIGNLNGTYGYGSTIYGAAFGNESATNITIDATNGIRIRNGTTNKLSADTSGNLSITGDLSVGTAGAIRSGATAYGTGTGYWLDYNSGTPRLRVGNPAGNRLSWDGTDLTVGQGTLLIDSTGITLSSGSSQTWTAGSAFRFTGANSDLGTFGWAYTDGSSNVYRGLELTATNTANGSAVDQSEVKLTARVNDGSTRMSYISVTASSTVGPTTTGNIVLQPYNNGDVNLNGYLDLSVGGDLTAVGGAQTLPANPCGFITIKYQGNAYLVPVYHDSACP